MMRQLYAARLRAIAALRFACLPLFLPLSALAGEESQASMPGAEVYLLSGVVAGAAADAGIELRLAPGWKTYWRYPGDSGVPPSFSFTGSQNVLKVEMAWPAPKRFADGSGGFSIGYKGTILFPLKVTLAQPGQPAHLKIAFDFAVCDALCMPARADLAVDLGGEAASAQARIAAARATVPEPRPPGGSESPSVQKVELDLASTPLRLAIEVRAANPKADLFVEGPDERWALPLPQKTALPDGAARFVVPLEGVPPGAQVPGAQLRLTLVDGPKAIVTQVSVPTP